MVWHIMFKTQQMIMLVALGLIGSPCFAMRAMTNDEVRQEIMKGAMKDYESGSCPAEFVMKPESPVQISKSSDQSSASTTQSTSKRGTTQAAQGVSSWFNNGPAFSIANAIGQSSESSSSSSRSGSQSESKSYTEFPGTCTCPCPFSKDLKGKECGDASVYFQYPDGSPYKVPCYASDIKDWQITDYRRQFGIPTPEQVGTSQKR